MTARIETRLRRLEAQAQVTTGLRGEGLAALLAYTQQPRIEAGEDEGRLDAATPPRGLARCLWEIWYGKG